MRPSAAAPALRVRELRAGDLPDVVRVDAAHTGRRKRVYWESLFRQHLARGPAGTGVGLVAEDDVRLAGYLFGEIRAFEFGSEPCGWILAVGVDPARARCGVGSRLVAEAGRRFRRAGVARVRTLVRRHDVPILAFFRSNGFVGGSFFELELDLAAEHEGKADAS